MTGLSNATDAVSSRVESPIRRGGRRVASGLRMAAPLASCSSCTGGRICVSCFGERALVSPGLKRKSRHTNIHLSVQDRRSHVTEGAGEAGGLKESWVPPSQQLA